MLTLTDKLILCKAVDLFSGNPPKIRLYIKARAPHFDVSKWEEEYSKLKSEALSYFYKSPTEYSADKRALIVPTSFSDQKNNIPIFEAVLISDGEEEKITPINLKKKERHFKSFYSYEEEKPVAFSKKEEVPIRVSKRIWQRMSIEERSYEETLSNLEDQAYLSDNLNFQVEENFFSIPSEDDRKLSLEEHFECLVAKYTNKKILRDRLLWPYEYKVMVRYLVFFVKDHFMIPHLQKIVSEKVEVQLPSAVAKVMEIIQKMMFESDNLLLRHELNSIKMKFHHFYDFYKK